MKILITRVGSAIYPDGINAFVYELADAFINLGHDVYLVFGCAAYEPGGLGKETVEERIKRMFAVDAVPCVISLSSYPHCTGSYFSFFFEQNFLFLFRGSKIISEISPDMVIFNGATTTRCSSFKVAVNHDLQFRSSLLKCYDMLIYRTLDKVIATSNELRQEFARQLNMKLDKVVVIPICIDARKYMSRSLSERKRAILHIGTRREKNPESTVDAFEMIAKHDSEIKLFVVGEPHELRERLKARIKRKDIRRRIFLMGRVSKEKLRNLYSYVRVTSVPSLYSVPVLSPTVLESLASGTPVVCSSSGVSQDILKDGYNGFRVRSRDSALLAERILMLMSDNELWKRMSRNSLYTSRFYDKIYVAKEYLSLLNKH